MEINRQTVQLLRPEIEAALQPLAKEHNLNVKVANATYDPNGTVTYKLEVAVIRADGTAVTKEAAEFLRSVQFLKPFQATDLNREFTFKGETYRLTGYRSRAGKFPLVGTRVRDGQQMKFGEELVAVAMYGREAYQHRYKPHTISDEAAARAEARAEARAS
jgi:hypothetical protein